MCLTALTSIFGPLAIKERKKEEGEEAGSNLSKNKPHKIPRAKTKNKTHTHTHTHTRNNYYVLEGDIS